MPIEVHNDLAKMTASIDRKLNEIGYHRDNVWFVHKHVNLMKWKFRLDHFIDLCKAVTSHNPDQ